MGGCSPIIPIRDVIKMDDAELHEPRTQTRASNPDTCNVSSQSSSHASSISEPRTLTPCDASLLAGLWAAVIECPVRVFARDPRVVVRAAPEILVVVVRFRRNAFS